MRVVIHKSGMLEMTIINVIFLTNVENCFRVVIIYLLVSNPGMIGDPGATAGIGSPSRHKRVALMGSFF